jgi:predicted ArsR family transcriptional regulator
MATRKFEDSKLKQLVKRGFTVNEIAEKLNVTTNAVRRRLKLLDVAVAKQVTVSPRDAREVVSAGVDAMGRLQDLHERAYSLLDTLEKVGKGELPQEAVEAYLAGKTSPAEAHYKLLGECRKQLQTAMEFTKFLRSAEEVEYFQRVILEEVRMESPELQQRILERLARRCQLASSIEYTIKGNGI